MMCWAVDPDLPKQTKDMMNAARPTKTQRTAKIEVMRIADLSSLICSVAGGGGAMTEGV